MNKEEEEEKKSDTNVHAGHGIQLNEDKEKQISKFECNICFEIPQEPIITQCGHMYCWPCIYRWLNTNQDFLSCPVCKNGIESKKLIPLYTKESYTDFNVVKNRGQDDILIPPRPKPERERPIQNMNALGLNGNFQNFQFGSNVSNGIMLAGYGFFPSQYNLIYQVKNDIQDIDEQNPSPEVLKQPLMQKLYYLSVILFILVIALFIIF